MTDPINLRDHLRDIRDFPKPGIVFRDITPLLAHPAAFRHVVDRMAVWAKTHQIDSIAAAEARGFLFAAPLACELGLPLVPVRKPGKLPFRTHRYDYDLEYGSDSLEIHTDAAGPGDRVLLVDDLLATGGTVAACAELIEQTGAEVVGCLFLIELTYLGGREKLAPHTVESLVQYDSEE